MMMFITFLLPLVLKKFPAKGVTTLFVIIQKLKITIPKKEGKTVKRTYLKQIVKLINLES
jgi:hypothetical protein